MKILIASDFYINNLGGVTTSILNLVKGLRQQQHEVKILTLAKDNISYQDNDDYYIRSYSAYYAPGMRFTLAFNDPLLKELIRWQPDIVHVQSEGTAYTMAMKIAGKCNAPLIMTSHTDYTYFLFGQAKDQPLIAFLAKIIGRMIYGPADQIVVPSKKSLNFSFLDSVKDRLSVVPNGIEISEYQKKLTAEEKAGMRKKLKISSDVRILTAVTRLSKEKNIAELITYLPSLLKRCPKTVLLIVGEGPDYENLRKLTAESKLENHVIFAGRVAAAEVWRYYDLSDIFVSASLFEVHSMTYIEALAAGIPLLCRQDESLAGVLEQGINGYAYATEDEFVTYASAMLDDEELRRRMAEAAFIKAEDFSADKFAAAAIEVYKNTINNRRTLEKADDAAFQM